MLTNGREHLFSEMVQVNRASDQDNSGRGGGLAKAGKDVTTKRPNCERGVGRAAMVGGLLGLGSPCFEKKTICEK